jgi:exonuclease III
MEAMLGVSRAWRRRPALILGDTNSGRPVLDEESPVFGPRYAAWFDAIEALGWRDAFRHVHGGRLEYTWYSPNGRNGFRIDQAFASRPLLPRLTAVEHAWALSAASPDRRDAISDHAALIVELDPGRLTDRRAALPENAPTTAAPAEEGP